MSASWAAGDAVPQVDFIAAQAGTTGWVGDGDGLGDGLGEAIEVGLAVALAVGLSAADGEGLFEAAVGLPQAVSASSPAATAYLSPTGG